MFIAAKIFALLTQPLAWVAMLLLVGLLHLQRRPRRARQLCWAALALLLAMGWQPLPDMLLRHLESQYAEVSPSSNLQGYTGIVILGGGAESGYLQQAHQQPLLNDAAERLTAAIAMLQHNPQLRLVYTGGEGALMGTGPSEAERARLFFVSMGVPAPKIELESVSRNTHENALLTAQMHGIDRTQHWLLVTSAWHMPRAMATFTKAGWNVTAYPVDFRTAPTTPWTLYSLNAGAERWRIALNEILGLGSYRIVGWL